jgi:hypothetical protein
MRAILKQTHFACLIAALGAGSFLAGCAGLEERQDFRTSRLESRQDRYDTRAEGVQNRRSIRSERMDERMESRMDSW